MVYDQNRDLDLNTSHESTTPAAASAKHEGLEAMQQLVHRKGVNLKAYFQAYVTPQKKLRIIISSLVSSPGW